MHIRPMPGYSCNTHMCPFAASFPHRLLPLWTQVLHGRAHTPLRTRLVCVFPVKSLAIRSFWRFELQNPTNLPLSRAWRSTSAARPRCWDLTSACIAAVSPSGGRSALSPVLPPAATAGFLAMPFVGTTFLNAAVLPKPAFVSGGMMLLIGIGFLYSFNRFSPVKVCLKWRKLKTALRHTLIIRTSPSTDPITHLLSGFTETDMIHSFLCL